MMATMKTEPLAESCSVCGTTGEELYSPEEHDAGAPPASTPLRAMLLHLNNNKVVPSGRLCNECIRRTVESYNFSVTLGDKGPPSLSEKIQSLRKKLQELTRSVDVFIVVGEGAAYCERDIIPVSRAALAPPAPPPPRGARGYQCTVCPDTLQRLSEYRSHVLSHGPRATHSCWACGAQFGSHDAAIEHARTHALNETYTCHACDTTFQSGGELRRHIVSCVVCPECGTSCGSRGALRVHMSRHPSRCAECAAPVPRAQRAAHRAAHLARHAFVCGYRACTHRAATRSELLSHIRTTHGECAPPAAPITTDCNICHRQFASVAALKRHVRVHRGENAQPSPDNMEYGEEEGEGHVEYLEMETLEEMEQDQNIRMIVSSQ